MTSLSAPDHAQPNNQSELSRGACFALVFSLALSLVYHPASGSLVFGPTSRFWIFSPIASITDALTILMGLRKHAAQMRRLHWSCRSPSSVSNGFSPRNWAYATLVARSLNASRARRLEYEEPLRAGDIQAITEVFETSYREIDEGWRFRIGIAIPILTQFVKIVVMRHVYLPKVLGSIYLIHWLTIEMLICLARPPQNATFTNSETKDIIKRVNQLHFRFMRNDPDDINYHMVLETLVFLFYMLILLPGATISLWICRIFVNFTDKQFSFAHMVVIGSNLVIWIRWPMDSLIKCRSGWETNVIVSRRFWRLIGSEPRASNVGGDGGMMFLAAWVVWCMLFYDEKGTQRPSWPWLDFLG